MLVAKAIRWSEMRKHGKGVRRSIISFAVAALMLA